MFLRVLDDAGEEVKGDPGRKLTSETLQLYECVLYVKVRGHRAGRVRDGHGGSSWKSERF